MNVVLDGESLEATSERVSVFRKFPFHDREALLSFDPTTFRYEKHSGLLGETATG